MIQSDAKAVRKTIWWKTPSVYLILHVEEKDVCIVLLELSCIKVNVSNVQLDIVLNVEKMELSVSRALMGSMQIMINALIVHKALWHAKMLKLVSAVIMDMWWKLKKCRLMALISPYIQTHASPVKAPASNAYNFPTYAHLA